MSPAKCPCCDGYGQRLRPAWQPGDGPVACVSCYGTGLVWSLAPVAPAPWLAPLVPYDPTGPWALPTVTCGSAQ